MAASPKGWTHGAGRSLEDVLTERDSSATPRTRSRLFSWQGVKSAIMSRVIGGASEDAADWAVSELPANFFDLKCNDSKGSAFPLDAFHGKVCLVVNVASF